jgi:membrane-bound inhibitor of C-type lysozyme
MGTLSRHSIPHLAVIVGAVVAADLALAGAASAEQPAQPPMNSFDFAYYACTGGAFQIAYDSETPTSATMTTSDDNRRIELARKPTSEGVQFSNGAVRFWTDGKTVVVQGTVAQLQNCKLQAN